MDSIARNQTEYAEQVPVEPERPAYNFSGNLFNTLKKNQNLSQIVGPITPENKVEPRPVKVNTFVSDDFWVDDNPQQNPVQKLALNEGRTLKPFEVSQVRDQPNQIDILEEDDMKKFKFSDQREETPEATRPRTFNDFFN